MTAGVWYRLYQFSEKSQPILNNFRYSSMDFQAWLDPQLIGIALFQVSANLHCVRKEKIINFIYYPGKKGFEGLVTYGRLRWLDPTTQIRMLWCLFRPASSSKTAANNDPVSRKTTFRTNTWRPSPASNIFPAWGQNVKGPSLQAGPSGEGNES